MKKRMTALMMLVLVVFAVSTLEAAEQDKNGKGKEKVKLVAQTTCPVMGGAFNQEIFTDYHGQRVYFCCNPCVETFNKDPETYFKKAASENILFENVQTFCPVSGDEIDRRYFKYYKGRGIYFCSKECVAAFEAEPEKYIDNLNLKKMMKKGDVEHDHEGHDHDHDHGNHSH